MQIDYKRDLNHTYVILQEEKEPDTASYQIRMLLTNTIPGLLDCKIGKMDDKSLFYYEVTSKQSLQSVFEQRSRSAAGAGFCRCKSGELFLLLSAGKAGTHRLFSEADPGADGISAAEAGSPGAGCGGTRVWTVSGEIGGDLFG